MKERKSTGHKDYANKWRKLIKIHQKSTWPRIWGEFWKQKFNEARASF